MVQSFKRKASPALILGTAALRGRLPRGHQRDVQQPVVGAPFQAVLGTMAVARRDPARLQGGLDPRDRAVRTHRYGHRHRLHRGHGGHTCCSSPSASPATADCAAWARSGAIVGILAILIGAFFLTLDFKQIEDGIAYGRAEGGGLAGRRSA